MTTIINLLTALTLLFALLALFCFIKWQKAEAKEQLFKEKLDFMSGAQESLANSFKLLSSEALEKSQHSFLHLAKETLGHYQERAQLDLEKRQDSIEKALTPVKESLSQLDKGMQALEKERKGEQESLKAQLRVMTEAERELRRETSTLVGVLKMRTVRGRFGEMQLRRIVEVAGMVAHCDFYEQSSAEGGQMRPDMIVRLPGNKQVIVDAKTPSEAYFEAIETEDHRIKGEKLKHHAKLVRHHVTALGKKAYWQSFQPTPEFVILFIPSDSFFSAALEFDPALIEVGVEQGVIIATPTTLIGLLKAIAYGWKQETLSRHAEEVSLLGHELYKRIASMTEHVSKVGRSLSSCVDAYNRAVGSLETRVLVSARRFKEMGAAADSVEIEPLEGVDRLPRELQRCEEGEYT